MIKRHGDSANLRRSVDDIMYKYIEDIAGATYDYFGTASPGSLTSNPVWRIMRVNKVSGSFETAYPDGRADFNQIWDNRTTLTYL